MGDIVLHVPVPVQGTLCFVVFCSRTCGLRYMTSCDPTITSGPICAAYQEVQWILPCQEKEEG